MPAHLYHQALEGYDERQILHDGCPECESRKDFLVWLRHADQEHLIKAAHRGRAFELGRTGDIGRVSKAEAPILSILGQLSIRGLLKEV